MSIAYKHNTNLSLTDPGSLLLQYSINGSAKLSLDANGKLNLPTGGSFTINNVPIGGGDKVGSAVESSGTINITGGNIGIATVLGDISYITTDSSADKIILTLAPGVYGDSINTYPKIQDPNRVKIRMRVAAMSGWAGMFYNTTDQNKNAICVSNDHGASWRVAYSGIGFSPANLDKLFSVNGSYILAVNNDNHNLAYSTDLGISFAELAMPVGLMWAKLVSTDTNVYALSSTGALYSYPIQSLGSGSWTQMSTPAPTILDMDARSQNIILMSSDTTIHTSGNSGVSWNTYTVNNVKSVFVSAAETLFFTGDISPTQYCVFKWDGTGFDSSNIIDKVNLDWSGNLINTGSRIYHIVPNYISYSDDDGGTWTMIPPGFAVTSVIYPIDGTYYYVNANDDTSYIFKITMDDNSIFFGELDASNAVHVVNGPVTLTLVKESNYWRVVSKYARRDYIYTITDSIDDKSVHIYGDSDVVILNTTNADGIVYNILKDNAKYGDTITVYGLGFRVANRTYNTEGNISMGGSFTTRRLDGVCQMTYMYGIWVANEGFNIDDVRVDGVLNMRQVLTTYKTDGFINPPSSNFLLINTPPVGGINGIDMSYAYYANPTAANVIMYMNFAADATLNCGAAITGNEMPFSSGTGSITIEAHAGDLLAFAINNNSELRLIGGKAFEVDYLGNVNITAGAQYKINNVPINNITGGFLNINTSNSAADATLEPHADNSNTGVYVYAGDSIPADNGMTSINGSFGMMDLLVHRRMLMSPQAQGSWSITVTNKELSFEQWDGTQWVSMSVVQGNQAFAVPTVPVLATDAVTSITYATATCGGGIISTGNSTITDEGICWSLNPNPTISNNIISAGSILINFTCLISGLTVETVYYVRAYATNAIGTAYGQERTFTTTGTVAALGINDAVIGVSLIVQPG
jgi:hypothetical protein